MSRREAKTAMYEQFARAGKGLANPMRLELLDLLAQGERSVESLATAAGLGLSTASMHLQALKDSGLVRARRDGTFIHYRLAGDDVAALFVQLRTVATAQLADAERAAQDYLGTPLLDTDAVERDELLRRRPHRRRHRPGRAPNGGVRRRAHPRSSLPATGRPRATTQRPTQGHRDRRLLPGRLLRAGPRRGRTTHRVRPARPAPA